MRSHALRPLYTFVCVIIIILAVRTLVVPRDFGIGERGYMYGWHRKGNEAEWKALPAAFQPMTTCKDCHPDQYGTLIKSPHAIINCQNCHGPAGDHPTSPPKLPINRDRSLCLRCHAKLNYPNNPRGVIPGIDPATHNPGTACADCHNPHKPSLEGLKS